MKFSLVRIEDDDTVGEILGPFEQEEAVAIRDLAKDDVVFLIRPITIPEVVTCDECGNKIIDMISMQNHQHSFQCSLHPANEVLVSS